MSAPTPLLPSWVVWLKDGRYSYAWGATADEAKQNYMDQWGEGIARIAPAGEHKNLLPPQHFIPVVTERLRKS